jgi:hypothetical protein
MQVYKNFTVFSTFIRVRVFMNASEPATLNEKIIALITGALDYWVKITQSKFKSCLDMDRVDDLGLGLFTCLTPR